MRPSLILPENAGVLQQMAGFFIGSVTVNEVARSAIRLALNGSSTRSLENSDLVELGRRT